MPREENPEAKAIAMPWERWKGFRTYFEGVAADYDRLRPDYPGEFFEWLSTNIPTWPPCRTIDVGAGTGFASLPLAGAGSAVMAVEQSADMCKCLSGKAARMDKYEVAHSRFEEMGDDVGPFDLAVCGTAFHWLDPGSRVARIARVLGEGGWLCLVWNVFEEDAVCRTIREALDRCCPSLEIERSPAHAPSQHYRNVQEEVAGTGELCLEGTREWIRSRRYVRDDVLAMLLTHTGVRALQPSEIESLRDYLSKGVGAEVEVAFRTKAILFRRSGHAR